MDVHITKSERFQLQTTPWALAVAAGAGVMSYLVCRKLFKESKAASWLQTYIVVTSAYGALKAPHRPVTLVQVCDEVPEPNRNGAVTHGRDGHSRSKAESNR